MRNEEVLLLVSDIDSIAPILRPFENAWRTATVDRLDVLADGLAHFRSAGNVLEQARRFAVKGSRYLSRPI